jgi:hypothetical protein
MRDPLAVNLVEQESVMRGEASEQRFGELLHFGCQAASRAGYVPLLSTI